MLRNRRNVSVLATIAFLSVMAALVIPAHAAGKGGKWISLRCNFKPGQTLKYGLLASVSGTIAMAGGGGQQQSMPVNVKLQTNVNMEVLEVDSQGTATARVTLDDINVDMQTMGQSMEMRMGAGGMKMYSGGMLLFDSSQAGGAEQLPMGNIG